MKYGKNKIKFEVADTKMEAEIYLFKESDKLLVSDFDGTATKSDVRGLIHNFKEKDYLHDSYA